MQSALKVLRYNLKKYIWQFADAKKEDPKDIYSFIFHLCVFIQEIKGRVHLGVEFLSKIKSGDHYKIDIT